MIVPIEVDVIGHKSDIIFATDIVEVDIIGHGYDMIITIDVNYVFIIGHGFGCGYYNRHKLIKF